MEFLQDPNEEASSWEVGNTALSRDLLSNTVGTDGRIDKIETEGANPNKTTSPHTVDPLMDQLNFLGSPLQQTTSIDQSLSADIFSDIFDPKSKDPALDPSDVDPLQTGFAPNNFAETSLPDNFNDNFSENMFLSSQYFSPNNRGNFSSLNAIAEDSMQLPNTITPNMSRHGSVSVHPPHDTGNSYLSPKKFMSPQTNAYDGSFDTLTSPYSSISGSYLNSPPPMMLNQNFHPQLSASPKVSAGDSHIQAESGSKQLTQEEKIKRRREFHNAVERRRRDLIKEKIKALGLLVPPSMLTPQQCAVHALSKPEVEKTGELSELLVNGKVKETKPNKAIILRESVSYIRHLQVVSERQNARRKELEAAILALESEPKPYDNEDDFIKDILNT